MDFFNDLGKRVSTAAKTVQKRTREGVETSKLNAQMRTLRDQRNKLFTSLGEAYYAGLNGGTGTDPIDFLVEQLKQVEAQQAQLQAEIDRLSQQKRCPSCGKVIPLEARFCPNCGTKIPEEEKPAEPEAPAAEAEPEYCPNCGAARDAGTRFCISCGHDFEAEASEDTEPEGPETEEEADAEEEQRITMKITWPAAEEDEESEASEEDDEAPEDPTSETEEN